MVIEHKYVTFDQAKKLKEKEFDVPCTHLYCIGAYNIKGSPDLISNNIKGSPDLISNNIKDGYGNIMGFRPRTVGNGQPHLVLAPEHWQLIDWLEKNRKVFVWVEPKENCQFEWSFRYNLLSGILCFIQKGEKRYGTREEAYSAAFDYILDKIL